MDKTNNKKALEKENSNKHLTDVEKSWSVAFFVSGWLVISFIILSNFPQSLIYQIYKSKQKNKDNSPSQIYALVENQKPTKSKPKKKVPLLSTEDSEARGDLTKAKGFEAKSEHRKLMFAKKGSKLSGKQSEVSIMRTNENDLRLVHSGNRFYVDIYRDNTDKPGHRGKYTWATDKKTTIPHYYRFQRKFAFSWDKSGKPKIPTIYYKHYEYFKKMLDTIRRHWSPPGGVPGQTYGDAYHSMNPVPGFSRFQAFPEQEVQVLFMLDSDGIYMEAKIWKSLGYDSLNSACLDAIRFSHDFGPPPKELIDNGVFVMPLVFQILSR